MPTIGRWDITRGLKDEATATAMWQMTFCQCFLAVITTVMLRAIRNIQIHYYMLFEHQSRYYVHEVLRLKYLIHFISLSLSTSPTIRI